MTITEFLSGKQEKWDISKGSTIESAHGGGDWGLVHDFVQAISQQDASLLSTRIEDSMESHLMAFKGEESRLNGGKVMEMDLKSET